MSECFGQQFILNGEIYPSEFFSNSMIYEGESVYEVLRVVNGIPVFFNDHIERLNRSVELLQKRMLADSGEIKRAIAKLNESGVRKEINLKIVFNYNNGSNNFIVYFIESQYPDQGQYSDGVKGIIVYAERKEPGSKIINHKLRSSIYHKLILKGAYEALLVNERNMITEGSRSNIFFVKGDHLVTAPDDNVLRGITRKYILEVCRDNNIEVKMECVPVEKISDYDAVFMTGTSPVVLPFNYIEDIEFNVTIPVIKHLRELLHQKIEENINSFQND